MPMVLITHRIPCEGMEPLFDRYNVCIPPADAVRFDDAQLDELLPQADVLLACGRISGEQIEKAERLRLICVYGAGYERVDVEAATRRGIPVCTIPDAVTDGTAELALTLLLSVSRRVGELNRRLRQQKPESLFGMGLNTGQSLSGRTLGIVGMGRIGRRMAQMCRALGMHIVYHNRKPLPKPLEQGAQYLPLHELLRVGCWPRWRVSPSPGSSMGRIQPYSSGSCVACIHRSAFYMWIL